MANVGKRYSAAAQKIEPKAYSLSEAIGLVKGTAGAKFDETFEVSMRLGVDPKHADQMVRGTVVLPHGTGKARRVVVIASGDKISEAEAAGADVVGGEELVEKISGGWLDFDVVVATPDMMKHVGKLGRVLGPRGMMPNPKSDTVTMEVGRVVQEVKAGKVEFRVDKTANLHVPVGKVSFTEDALQENLEVLVDNVFRAKPASAKGAYLKSMFLSSTMGPGVRVDISSIERRG